MLSGDGHLIILKDGVLSSATRHTVDSSRVLSDADEVDCSGVDNHNGEKSIGVETNSDPIGTDKETLAPLEIPGLLPEIDKVSVRLGIDESARSHWTEGRRYAIDRDSNASTSNQQVLLIGAWRIVLSRVPSREVEGTEEGDQNNDSIDANTSVSMSKTRGHEHVRTLQTVRSLLGGEFSYHLNIPESCKSLATRPSAQSSSSSSGPKKVQVSSALPLYCDIASHSSHDHLCYDTH